jgi:hypothetical protein
MAIIRSTNGHAYKVSGEDLAIALKKEEGWAAKFREALASGALYNEEKHRELAQDMEAIEVHLGNYAGGTIFDHVRSIFDDSVTRGFRHDLHFPQLIAQYKRYGFGDTPEPWIPPPDTHGCGGTPALPNPVATHPPPAHTSRPAMTTNQTPAVQLRPPLVDAQHPEASHGERKPQAKVTRVARMTAKPTILKRIGGVLRVVPIERSRGQEVIPTPSEPNAPCRKIPLKSKSPKSKSPIEHPTERDDPARRPRNVPSGAMKYEPGCSRCERAERACWVLHRNNTEAACYGCRYGRVKCDIIIIGRESNDDDDKESPAVKKSRHPRRKQLSVVEPGKPGEYNGK